MAIASRRNRNLKTIRRLKRCKGDHAILEGPHLVAEACDLGLALDSVLMTPEFRAGAGGRALEPRLARPPLEVEPRLLAELADADAPRGVVAVAHLPRAGTGALPAIDGGVYLYCETIQDPGNLGALARVAEAAGAAALALGPGSAHPNHPRALRASAGSLLRLPLAIEASPADLDARLGELVPRWLALVPRGGEPPASSPAAGTLIVAAGAEGPGLSPELVERCHQRLTVPLAAPVESLNVAVAVALVLFEIRRIRG